ncbi:MAG: hypothetical protein ABI885_26210 [Gammaproteobacteria bacterium]
MNLLFAALRTAIDEAAKGRGLENFRISYKWNATGEFVIAVITSDPRLAQEKLETARERALTKPRRG